MCEPPAATPTATQGIIGYVLWNVRRGRAVERRIFDTQKQAKAHRALYCKPRDEYEIRGVLIGRLLPPLARTCPLTA